MSLGAIVSKVVQTAEADALKVKAAILKAMNELDGVILPEAAKIEPMVASLAQQIAPGAGPVINIAYAGLEALAKVIDAGGAAAEANLTNAGLDSALISSVKGLIPQLKAAAAAK